MSEVLKLEYSAFNESLLVTLDAVKVIVDPDGSKRTIVMAGPTQPQRQFTLEKLADIDADLVVDLRSILLRLEPIVRKMTDEDVKDEDQIRQEASRVAANRQALSAEKEAHEDFLRNAAAEKATIEQSKADAAVAAATAEDQLQAVRAQLAAKRAELAALESPPLEAAEPLRQEPETKS